MREGTPPVNQFWTADVVAERSGADRSAAVKPQGLAGRLATCASLYRIPPPLASEMTVTLTSSGWV